MLIAAFARWPGLMRLWIPVFAGAAALTGCNEPAPKPAGADIACKLAGESAFTRECTVERAESPDGPTLTLHHPDGGFRRLLVTGDGQGVTAADGAEPAEVRMSGDNEIEVRLGGNIYRLPAKPKQPAIK